jgi:hypothetical protein
MDDQRFDAFARSLAASSSRRSILRILAGTAAGGVLATLGGFAVTAASAPDETATPIEPSPTSTETPINTATATPTQILAPVSATETPTETPTETEKGDETGEQPQLQEQSTLLLVHRIDENGQPFPGSCFRLYLDAGDGTRGQQVSDSWCDSDNDGAVSIPVAPNSYVVAESGLSHCPQVTYSFAQDKAVAVQTDQVTAVTIGDYPQGIADITMVDGIGQLAMGARLGVEKSEGGSAWGGGDGVCGPIDGQVTIRGLVAGASYIPVAQVNCSGISLSPFAVAAGQTANVTAQICPDGYGYCGSGRCVDSCANLSSDSNNCGGCGNICASDQTCVNGTCTAPCAAGETTCNGLCVDITSDPHNCGSCGNICPANRHCDNGVCKQSGKGSVGGALTLAVPSLSQTDSRWDQKTLGFNDPNALDKWKHPYNIHWYGCFITSIAMLFDFYRDGFTYPDKLNDTLKALGLDVGFARNTENVVWAGTTNVAPSGVSYRTADTNWANVRSELVAGRPVLASLTYGKGRTHMVIIIGMFNDLKTGATSYQTIDAWDGGLYTWSSENNLRGALATYTLSTFKYFNGSRT